MSICFSFEEKRNTVCGGLNSGCGGGESGAEVVGQREV